VSNETILCGGCSSEDMLSEFEGEAERSGRMEDQIGVIYISFQKDVNIEL